MRVSWRVWGVEAAWIIESNCLLVTPSVRTGGRRNPATCGTNHWPRRRMCSHSEGLDGGEPAWCEHRSRHLARLPASARDQITIFSSLFCTAARRIRRRVAQIEAIENDDLLGICRALDLRHPATSVFFSKIHKDYYANALRRALRVINCVARC